MGFRCFVEQHIILDLTLQVLASLMGKAGNGQSKVFKHKTSKNHESLNFFPEWKFRVFISVFSSRATGFPWLAKLFELNFIRKIMLF